MKKTNTATTDDYSLFKWDKSNREIVPGHVNKVKKAIERSDLTHLVPIIVNKNMEITDGQHRFLACKAMDKPIYYTISETCKDEDLVLLNTAQKPWGNQDYLNYYVSKNRSPYVKLKEFKEKTGLTMRNCLVWCSNVTTGNTAFANFKSGKMLYEFDERKEAIFKDFQTLSSLVGFEKVHNESVFQKAAIYVLESPLVDNEEFLVKASNWLYVMPRHARVFDYVSELVEIYNYKKIGRNRLEVSKNGAHVRIFSALHVRF